MASSASASIQLRGFLHTEDPDWGLPVFTGQVANAYLWTRGQVPGYCVVIWRDGHVCEPTDLDPADAGRYFADVLAVGRALTTLLGPAKLNYQTLGNAVPHLYTHVVPRGHDAPNPGGPLPAATMAGSGSVATIMPAVRNSSILPYGLRASDAKAARGSRPCWTGRRRASNRS